MGSAYTAPVADGSITTFQEFVWRCARAYGALYCISDEPRNAPIPDVVPIDDYYTGGLADAQAALRSWDQMNEAVRAAQMEEKRLEDIARATAEIERATAENARITAMMDKVQAWTPPTPDHVDLKEFMLKQLKDSLNDTSYGIDRLNEAQNRQIRAIIQDKRVSLGRSVERWRETLGEQATIAARNTAWLKALRESVAPPPPINPVKE